MPLPFLAAYSRCGSFATLLCLLDIRKNKANIGVLVFEPSTLFSQLYIRSSIFIQWDVVRSVYDVSSTG